ncbi:hypothetical protein TRFO_10324 [Tritrichomonas foetus]|uniref:Uncharacterized protein n=1 Tax=Tritrichomonas foetus TaxID=1144522 RepID=A0A1J4JEK6_9EUKA|nr:hypothetical protein TRFO_10324 [Tritrichomonas foetus]|eukprot:OHS95692.1 hypothetical protein TRFO_10324 [Tritrichomonas foetus]
MSGVRIIIYSRSGALLADVQNGELPSDEDANFKGVLSILEPIASTEPTFLFSMRLGSFIIDVSFDCGIYVFSIISAKLKSNLQSYNPFFSYTALLVFNNLISDLPNRHIVPKEIIDKFRSLIPSDPLIQISKILEELLIDSINYIAFVAQGHRVVLSLGETKIAPDKFIFEWCAALEASGGISSSNDCVVVPDHQSIAVSQFYPCLKTILFFADNATNDRMQLYLSEVAKAKVALQNLFKEKELKPQMPQKPKEASGRRKINAGKK